MKPNRVLLDVDSSILERNLKITEDAPEEDYMKNLFPEVPYKLVKPFPGLCLKMFLTNKKKLFVNLCQIDIIPAPRDINPEDIYNEETSFRVPMSIGDIRYEIDKKGDESTVVDIAVNNNFFDKINSSDIMTQFIIEVIKESLNDKYKLQIEDEVRVLKNRKCMGELQMHRIEKREIDEKMGVDKNTKKTLIKEISSNYNQQNKQSKPQIEILDENDVKTPQYRLFKTTDKQCLIAEILLPYTVSNLTSIGASRPFSTIVNHLKK